MLESKSKCVWLLLTLCFPLPPSSSVRTLGKGRQGVGDVDMVEDEDTSSWVESMRKKDEEKRMADKKVRVETAIVT